MRFSSQNILTILGDLVDMKMFLAAYKSILNIEAIINVLKLNFFLVVPFQRAIKLDFTGISGKPAAFKILLISSP